MFLSTRPRGARPASPWHGADASSFYPRARGGRDNFYFYFYLNDNVSIHAPAGGATDPLKMRERIKKVSIHAPAGGATQLGLTYDSGTKFLSTRPRGARHALPTLSARLLTVSIHAPAGGATNNSSPSTRCFSFLSTRPRGARPLYAVQVSYSSGFLSTRPRGARLEPVEGSNVPKLFLSTRPRGARHRTGHYQLYYPLRFYPRARGGRDIIVFN